MYHQVETQASVLDVQIGRTRPPGRMATVKKMCVESFLWWRCKQASVIGDNDMIKALLDPRRWIQPEIPTRQLAFLMLRNCLQFRGDYWLRHLPPQVTEAFAEALDASTWGFLEHAIGDKLSD